MSSELRYPAIAGACLLAASLASSRAAAETAYLVKDINQTGAGASSAPDWLIRMGNAVYFAAADGEHGRELWKTDGTETGTVLVADIAPGLASSTPRGLTILHETLFFIADDAENGAGLWRSNGTATGTKLVRAVPEAAPFGDGHMRVAGDVLFFRAGAALWRSDGTPEGTQIAVAQPPGMPGSEIPPSVLVDPVALGNALLFIVVEPGEKASLWRTLGTAGSTTLLKSADPGSTGQGWAISYLTRVGDVVFFAANDAGQRALWKTDGTAAGTVLVQAIEPSGLTNIDGTLFFAGPSSPSCTDFFCGALWTSDGMAGGTKRITDVFIATSPILAGADWRRTFVKAGSDVFFDAHTPQNGLWKSDGTKAGTQHVKQVAGGFPSIGELVDLNGTLLFTTGHASSNGPVLWRSDGSAAGTVLIASAPRFFPSGLTALGSIALFAGTDDARGEELWRTDGTEAGTTLVRDIEPGGQTANPALLADAGGTVYFIADDGTHGTELWKSDGTAAGTTLVADLTPGPGSTQINWLTSLGSSVLVGLTNDAQEAELWRADGAGLRLVHRFGPSLSIGPLGNGTVTGPLAPVGGAVYLSVRSQVEPYGTQLWRCDGSTPTFVQELAGYIYVSATDGTHVHFTEHGSMGALWRTDGTSAGTSRIAEFPTNILALVEAGGKVFFAIGRELWFVDATSETPTRVREFEGDVFSWALGALGRDVLFFVSSGPAGDDSAWSLWKSDGTPPGTTKLAGLPGQPEYGAATSGKTFFFQARGETSGIAALWATDGTAKGTRLVHQPLRNISPLTPLPGGSVIFGAGDTSVGGLGIEPWISDGTPAGTFELQQIGLKARSSAPAEFTLSGKRIFFTADDGVRGRELWALPWSPPAPTEEGCACAAPGRDTESRPTPLLTFAAIALAWLRRAGKPRATRAAPAGRATEVPGEGRTRPEPARSRWALRTGPRPSTRARAHNPGSSNTL